MIPTVMNMVKPPPHTSDYSDSISVTKLPIFGRIHFVRDREGITCVSITALYWLYGTFATLYFILYPQYREGTVSLGFIVGEYRYMCLESQIYNISQDHIMPLLGKDVLWSVSVPREAKL